MNVDGLPLEEQMVSRPPAVVQQQGRRHGEGCTRAQPLGATAMASGSAVDGRSNIKMPSAAGIHHHVAEKGKVPDQTSSTDVRNMSVSSKQSTTSTDDVSSYPRFVPLVLQPDASTPPQPCVPLPEDPAGASVDELSSWFRAAYEEPHVVEAYTKFMDILDVRAYILKALPDLHESMPKVVAEIKTSVDDVQDWDRWRRSGKHRIRPNYDGSQWLNVRAGTAAIVIKHTVERWLSDFGDADHKVALYSKMEKKVVVEELSNSVFDGPLYEFVCYRGLALFVLRADRHATGETSLYYWRPWQSADEALPGTEKASVSDRPLNYDRMLQIAEQISSSFHFLIVGLHSDGNSVSFSHLRFTLRPAEYSVWLFRSLHVLAGACGHEPVEYENDLSKDQLRINQLASGRSWPSSRSGSAGADERGAFEKTLTLSKEAYQEYSLDFAEQPCMRRGQNFAQWVTEASAQEPYRTFAPLADKVSAKYHAVKTVPWIRLTPTLAVLRSNQDLEKFLKMELPDSFVAKANHAAGSRFRMFVESGLVNGKATSREDMVLKFQQWLAECYQCDGQRQYEQIHRAIIIEALMPFQTDYKLMVYHGVIMSLFLKTSSKSGRTYSRSFTPTPIPTGKFQLEPIRPKPYGYEKLIAAAELLGQGFRFVRVDLYLVDGEVYFGELTFTPNAGKHLNSLLTRTVTTSVGLCLEDI